MAGDFGDPAYNIADVVQRLRDSDETLISIHLFDPASTEELLDFVDALLNHPNVVESIYLDEQQLTDDLGILLAQCVASSQTIRKLYLSHNQLGESTYRAFATALHTNTSLRKLMMENNSIVNDRTVLVPPWYALQRITPQPCAEPATVQQILYIKHLRQCTLEKRLAAKILKTAHRNLNTLSMI